MGLLVSLLTFCIVIALFFAFWMLVGGGDTKQELVRRRMEAVRKAERRGDVSTTLKLARDEMLSSVPVVHRMMMHWAWSVRLQEHISQAGLTMKAGKLVLIAACAALGTLAHRRHVLPTISDRPHLRNRRRCSAVLCHQLSSAEAHAPI